VNCDLLVGHLTKMRISIGAAPFAGRSGTLVLLHEIRAHRMSHYQLLGFYQPSPPPSPPEDLGQCAGADDDQAGALPVSEGVLSVTPGATKALGASCALGAAPRAQPIPLSRSTALPTPVLSSAQGKGQGAKVHARRSS